MAGTSDGARHPWRWVVLGVSTPLFICSQFYRVANAIVAPHLQTDMGLSSEALGGLSAAFFYAFALAQVPLALVLDRVGARASMTALSLVGAAGAVVFSRAGSAGDATLGEVLLGLGMAGNLMGTMKLVAHWFSAREFATVGGALLGLGTLGTILATTPLAVLVGAIGWRQSFLVAATVTAALALIFGLVVREHPHPEPAPSAGGGEVGSVTIGGMARRLLSSSDYWLISFGAFCRYGALAAIQGLWAGPYLIEVASLSPLRAANLILLLNLSVVVGSPLGGWLSDRVLASRKKLMLAALAGILVTELALALTSAAPRVWVIAIVFGWLGVTGAFGQVGYIHLKDLMPARMAGMAMTGVNFFTMLGAAAFMHGTGWMLDRWSSQSGGRGPSGYRAAFLATAAIVAVALALYTRTREAHGGAHPPEADVRS